MSINFIEADTIATPRRNAFSPAARVASIVASVAVGVLGRVIGEVVYMVREDCRNGRIERPLEDWER